MNSTSQQPSVNNAAGAPNRLLEPTPDPMTYIGTPGSLTLVLSSTVGGVALNCANTSVTDDGGAPPADLQCTGTALTFTLSAGKTYKASIRFVFIDPTTDAGELKEQCASPALDDIVTAAFMPIYKIRVRP